MQKSNKASGQNNEPIWFNETSTKGDTEVTTINIGTNSPHKIMVCTPVHSDTSMHYTQSVLKFQQDCMQRKILVSFTLMKSSLVTQGRNLCVAETLNHPDQYTHLLFIDSDIDFQSKTIFTMLAKDKDIISCVYPMKTFDWEKVWRRLTTKEGAINNYKDLMHSGYTYPVKVDDPSKINVEGGVAEVTHAPTGCMLIKRKVLEDMIKHYSELEIFQPTIINGKPEKKENMYNLFDTLHDPKTKRYFGEDFGFCQRWTDMGGKVHIYVDDYITHVGEYSYCSRFRDDLYQGSRPVKPIDDTKKIK
tara:strand:- start:1681 stop:2592 length:912 start_codon:yes stop_codon:yes gene_type:complete